MAQRLDQFQALDAQILAVSFTPPERVKAYLEGHPLPFPAASDPERKAYQAFSLGRTSWGGIFRPGVITRYLKLVFRGWRLEKYAKGDDLLQLGGDMVLDAAGRLIYSYPSREPTDRPPVEALLSAVKQAKGG